MNGLPVENSLIGRLAEELEQELMKRPLVYLNIKLEYAHNKEMNFDGLHFQFLMNSKYASIDQIELLSAFKDKYGDGIGQKCLDQILGK